MAEYPAATEGLWEKEDPHGLINDVREKRAYQKESYIYAASQGSKPWCFVACSAV